MEKEVEIIFDLKENIGGISKNFLENNNFYKDYEILKLKIIDSELDALETNNIKYSIWLEFKKNDNLNYVFDKILMVRHNIKNNTDFFYNENSSNKRDKNGIYIEGMFNSIGDVETYDSYNNEFSDEIVDFYKKLKEDFKNYII